jgi:hypothetical protein
MIKSQFRRSRASIVAGVALLVSAALTQGCLQREVKKQNPTTSNVFVEQIVNTTIDKIDLLFVIDNSVSMADKQEILALAVPEMVKRLVNPLCVDGNGNTTENPGDCPTGSAPEFNPVNNIHIGVISSSLGGHGSRSCPRVDPDPIWKNDDQGHLIGSVRGLPEEFLAWNGGGIAERDALVTSFTTHVSATGENGCGFEAPLEAWYRFLIDPQPPQDMVLNADSKAVMATNAEGVPVVDGTVLAQRAAFLRPDGLVAIVVLSDENDCSAMDGGSYYSNAGFGYLVAEQTYKLPIASSACDSNPNGNCCFSCLQKAPAGCEDYADECTAGTTLTPTEDRPNVRCFQNKRRFGVDLLYPTQRYVDALSKPTIVDARNGSTVDNPLLRSSTGQPRDPGLVFFAGIIGVPWQDVATDASLADASIMEYRTASELEAKDVMVTRNGAETLASRWEIILGNPGLAASSKVCQDNPSAAGCGAAPVLPDDPFMIESIVERQAGLANPISGDVIVDSTSTNPTANAINGHEANHMVVDNVKYQDGGPAADDLQYACIFPLGTPKDNCTAGDLSCDCGDEPSRNRPLCQPPAGGQATTTQNYGKAYPGTRILQVLRDFGENSIVGSICPKISTGDTQNPNFGYNPAVQAIVDRLAEKLAGKCLPRELTLDENGNVPCEVIEASPSVEDGGVPLDCSALGRTVTPGLVDKAVREQLEAAGRCGGSSDISCAAYQMCKITELAGTERNDCLRSTADPSTFNSPGFCYVDPALKNDAGDFIAGGPEAAAIVKNCPASERRLLRFVGERTPVPNSITLVACTGDAASKDAPIPCDPANPACDIGGEEPPAP